MMLQIIQTRILSVVAWYHLAFFVISMAMFGLTAGAVWVYLRGERYSQKTFSYDLSYYTAAFALATGICLLIQLSVVTVVVRSGMMLWVWAELALCIAIPFFFSGIVVSLALTRSPFPIGRVYGIDLLGAALGCLGVLVLLNFTDGPSAVLWVASLAALASHLFYHSRIGTEPAQAPPLHGLLRRRGIILAGFAALAAVNGVTSYGFQPLIAKGQFEGGDSHIFREWNTFSRIAVYPTRREMPSMWGPSPRFFDQNYSIEQRHLNIDGDAGTAAYRFTGDTKEIDFLKYDVTNLAYYLPDRQRVAVVGVGGGRDILSAALFRRSDITGVEINPIFVKLLTEERGFADFTNVNRLPGVRFEIDEGRSWFARTSKRFDIIQMSLIDTWAATGAGAFSLSENGLYTVEAWKIFLSRLTPNGVYTVSRWYNKDDPGETGRMLSLAVAALQELGVPDPRSHIMLAAQGSIATLIVGRQAFSRADLAALEQAAATYDHQLLISPGMQPAHPVLGAIVAAQDRDALEKYTSSLTFDLTPAVDDRPFFFNQMPLHKPKQVFQVSKDLFGSVTSTGGVGGVRGGNLIATGTLLMLGFIALIFVLAAIVIPLRPAIKDVGERLAIGGTLYFLLIGVGFMAVEIAMLQRMSVFLGHPIYSLSISLFTLIVTTGIGSLLSDRWRLDTRGRFLLWAGLTGGYLLSLPYWLPDILLAYDSSSLPVRAFICVLTIAPAGLAMGFGFPTGMRLISAIDRRPTPWFWGINGAAGVLASVMAIMISIGMGISATLTFGAICYLLLIPTVLVFFWRESSIRPAVKSEPAAANI